MVRKFTVPTGTILDNYPTFKAFTLDKSVTTDDLKKLINSAIYFSGTARHISRHVNCDESVFGEMQKNTEWYVRMVGYFCFRLGDIVVDDNAAKVLIEGTEDIRVLKRAAEIVAQKPKEYRQLVLEKCQDKSVHMLNKMIHFFEHNHEY